MSNAVSALNGASFKGFVTVTEMGLRGMITLRGDLASTDVKNAVTGVTGVDMPGRGEAKVNGVNGIAWMSPDELLVMVDYAEVDAKLTAINEMLAGQHFLAVNVSDARAVFQVQGTGVREVMAKLCPVDMAPGAFEPGMFRRTRMAQIPAAFTMLDAQTVQIICFRSVAQYAFDLLSVASAEGSQVGVYA